jgi:hypothetical protein
MGSLPTITSLEQVLPTLKIWQQRINPVVNTPVPPHAPFNVSASGGAAGATGITVGWGIVKGSDGYEVQMSTNGNFESAVIIALLTNPAATSYFDSTTVTSVKRYYRVRATAGTANQPHSVKGIWSAAINATSGSGLVTHDQTTFTSGAGGWNRPSNPGIGNRNRQLNTL